MKFSEDSEIIMRILMNNFSHFYKKKTPSQKKLHDDILKEIHSKLVIAERKMEDIWNKPTFYKNVREILNMNGIDISDGYFFPKHIQNDIKTNLIGEVSYRCKIFEREVSFSFYIMENELFNNIDKIDAIAKKMIMWLAFILPITKSRCSKTLNVICYLTSFKKELPESNLTILDANNANTAFTHRCPEKGEIIMYRKEEIFKVFIHETFHTLGLDWYNGEILSNEVNKLFPISSAMNLNESYCEFWACFMNSIFTAYSLPNGENISAFLIYSEYCLSFERLFSLIQMVKILRFMGLEYTHLYENTDISKKMRKMLYKEETNIFAYYILKCILLFNVDDFLMWCKKNNSNIFAFDETKNNFTKLYNFIHSNYKKGKFLKQIDDVSKLLNRFKKELISDENKILLNTMRMTIIETE
jgi:hypothetical protein